MTVRDAKHVLSVARRRGIEIPFIADNQIGKSIEQIHELRGKIFAEFKSFGLSYLTFRANSWIDTNEHRIALRNLIKTLDFKVEEALDLLKDLDEDSLKYISEFNRFQINSLLSLSNHGLTVAHLNGKEWFNTEDHCNALIYLMNTEPRHSADDAMTFGKDIIEMASQKYQMQVIKSACEKYLKFRNEHAPGHRGLTSINSIFHFRMSHLYHGSDGMTRVQAVMDKYPDYNEMLKSAIIAYKQSGLKKHSFRRFFYEAVIKDQTTVGKELSSDLLKGIKGDIEGRLVSMTAPVIDKTCMTDNVGDIEGRLVSMATQP